MALSLIRTHLFCRLELVAHCTSCALVDCELCFTFLSLAESALAYARLAVLAKASWLTFVRGKLTGSFGDSTPGALAGSGEWSCSSSSRSCGRAFSVVAGSTDKTPLDSLKQI